jgi:hypothetical protein
MLHFLLPVRFFFVPIFLMPMPFFVLPPFLMVLLLTRIVSHDIDNVFVREDFYFFAM